MKPSKQVKRAFRAWKSKTDITKVGLKEWARNHDTGGTPLSTVIQQWQLNKKVGD
jgi:hypothetical protein